MGQLVDLAQKIHEHAIALEKQLEAASAPHPSLEAGGPALYPTPSTQPDIFTTRSALIDASKQMYQLALGPGDTLRSMIGQERMYSFILNVVDRLAICDHVPPFPQSIPMEELAQKTSIDSDLLGRVLRFAASMNLFSVKENRVALTALSETLPMLSGWTRLHTRREVSCAISALPDSIANYKQPFDARSMTPWNVGNDMDTLFFDYLNAEPNGMENFGAAMRAHANVAGSDISYIADGYDWTALCSGPVVDVGGGSAHISVTLAKRFPKLQFIVQDLEPSKDAALNQIAAAKLQDRVKFQVQDFFKPQVIDHGAKAFLLRAILHDWRDEECVSILRNLLPAVEKGAKIVICDRILPATERQPTHMDSFLLFMDLTMYTLSGAKERSTDQLRAVLERTHPDLKILKVHQQVGIEWGLTVVGF